MRVLLAIFVLCSLCTANELVSSNDIAVLFRKFMLNELTEKESATLKQVLKLVHRPEYVSERSIEFSSEARMSIDCIICRSAFGALFAGIRAGQTDEEATDAIVTLCTSLGIESSTVCTGAVGLNIQTVAKNDKPLKLAIITDAHIDPLYEAFGVAECDAPVCCRKGQSPRSTFYQSKADDSLLEKSFIKDNHGIRLNLSVASETPMISQKNYQMRNPAPAGYWGDYRNCDTPLWAYDDAIENLYENHKDVEVIYYVGDTIDHGVWETSFELINNMNRYLVEKIRKTFGDHVLVVPAIGNHEAQPTNQFAPSWIVGEKLNTTWLYQALVDKWGFYLTDEAKQSLLERGDFSLLIRPGLRVISLNNNVAYRDNWWLVYDPLDAKRHLDWLVGELHKAELAGEKVHILAHIPPGVHDLTHTWTREYNRIVNRFSATIAAEFNGHTHADEFKIFYSPEGSPINVAWGAGSVTAFTFYNLNYKVATFDANTFYPERILNYAYNLTEANLTPFRKPHWFLLYDMKNSFGLTDLYAQSMHNLVYSMVTDNRRLFDMYSAFHSRLSDVRWPNCNDYCKIDNLCRVVITVLWERQRCDELRQIFFS